MSERGMSHTCSNLVLGDKATDCCRILTQTPQTLIIKPLDLCCEGMHSRCRICAIESEIRTSSLSQWKADGVERRSSGIVVYNISMITRSHNQATVRPLCSTLCLFTSFPFGFRGAVVPWQQFFLFSSIHTFTLLK